MKADWTNMLSPVPDDYQNRVESTLHDLKEDTMNRRNSYRAALVALMIILAVTGTALAVGQSLGLIDLFHRDTGLTVQPNAPDAIATALGSAENSKFRLTVMEAAYDGSAIRAIAMVEAVEKENYIPMLDGGYDARMGDQAEETLEEYARRTGRSLLDTGLADLDTTASQDTTGTMSERWENDNLILYGDLYLYGETPDTVEVTFSIYPEDQPLSVAFRLQKAPVQSKELLDAPVKLEGCTLQSVTRYDTPFATYVDILYTAEGEAAPFEEGITYYGTSYGKFVHSRSDCSGMTGASAISAADAIAQQKEPCPMCIPNASVGSASPAHWGFELMRGDDAMGLATSAGSNVTELGADSFTLALVYQAGSVPEDGLSLIPFSPLKGEMAAVPLK